jgi:hypothetical protein
VASAELGELFADVSDVTIEDFGDASSDLGGLTASASGVVTVVASASSGLGGVSSSASGVLTVVGSGEGLLGGVDASAVGVASEIGSASAGLGGLVGVAVGTVTPQPQPEPVSDGGGQPYPYRRQRPRKKVESVVDVVEMVVEPVRVVEGYVAPIVIGCQASAVGVIAFSAEEDDLQVVLML